MLNSRWMKTGCTLALMGMMMLPTENFAQERHATPKTETNSFFKNRPMVELAPPSSAEVAKYVKANVHSNTLSAAQQWALLQSHIKYVFVLFQENRSFDFYFGTYPGANGLFSESAANTPGFVQPIINTDGSIGSISPFLIPETVTNTNSQVVQMYPEDTDSVNHGHAAIDAKLDLNGSNVAQNDRYAFIEEGISGGALSADGKTYTGPDASLAQKQKGELVMGHVDCTAAPFVWNYADRFVLFDNFFDTVIGPSTPNAIAMFSGQSGETMWVQNPELGANYAGSSNGYVPVTGDPQPFWGSALDIFTPPSQQQPIESGQNGTVSTNPSLNLTFASLGLSFMGNQAANYTAHDLNPAFDLAGVQDDIAKLTTSSQKPVNWAWYQEGYDKEPTDPGSVATHDNYIAHHDAPQYFGYEANNPLETSKHMKGLNDFFVSIKGKKLTSGVYYIRGGYGNNDSLKPRSPSPAVQADFPGNDDHPGYSDLQISEALLADEINAIASSPYWPESVIIITYDETDGLYDHTQPAVRSWDALGLALDQGPRIPAIVISPYAAPHTISHEPSEHGSIIKFIDGLFNLTPLAQLPDEAAALKLGQTELNQQWLGPSDNPALGNGSLLSAFDWNRLQGTEPALPASYALIPTAQVTSLPHFSNLGCRILQITPTDYVGGKLLDPAPADFNPRPGSNPGNPMTPGWPTN